jgi:hypothetical protein
MQRRILAVVAVVSLLSAAAVWFWWPQREVELAFFARTGGLFLAAWLAYNDVQRLSGWLLLSLPVILIVVVRWPRLLPLLILALIVGVALRRVLSHR